MWGKLFVLLKIYKKIPQSGKSRGYSILNFSKKLDFFGFMIFFENLDFS